MSQINSIGIREKLANLSPIQFKNINDGTDTIQLVFPDTNTLFLKNIFDSSIVSTKIMNRPHNNNLKRRLSEIDFNEKLVFRVKIYDTSCIFSKYSVYFGEITLNQDEGAYFLLQIYKKNKQSTYVKDYIPIESYVSLI